MTWGYSADPAFWENLPDRIDTRFGVLHDTRYDRKGKDMEYLTNAPKGRDLLNERKPGWFRWIDVQSLHIHDIWGCVLAWVYGGYEDGLTALFGPDFSFNEAAQYGFNSKNGNGDRLQLEWIHIIAGLQLEDMETGDAS